MPRSSHLRIAVIALLLVSAGLFAVGSSLERNGTSQESAAAVSTGTEGTVSSQSGESGEGGESAEHRAAEQVGSTADSGQGEAGVTILGIDTESTGAMIAAVAASVFLAAAVWFIRSRIVLVLVAAFGLLFAAGDIRELLHQLDESRTSIAVIAGVLTVLHLAVAALAGLLLAGRTAADRGATAAPTRAG